MNRRQALRLAVGIGLPLITAIAIDQLPKKGVVNVPFAFQVDGKVLPAGEYSVRELSPRGPIEIQNRKTAASTRVSHATRKWASSDGAGLVFDLCEGRYYLSQIWFGSDTTGLILHNASAERAAATDPLHTIASVHFR
jgi:hypothetical protein